jgi:hypothetical protein
MRADQRWTGGRNLSLAALPVSLLAVAMGLARCSGPQVTVHGTAPPPQPTSSGTPVALQPTQSPSAAPATTSAAPPAVLVGAGDIASCPGTGDDATADLIDGIDGTVFTAGDNVYDTGTPWEFANCYDPSWGGFRDRTLPVPGNHDYATKGAAGYFGYFGAAAGDPSEGWYAVDVGPWRFYALNSSCWAIGGCEAGSRQERWLRADLAAYPRRCVLAVWHHPLFSSGEHGSDRMTQALWQALEDAGAEIVVSGHDHDYERFGPQAATGTPDPDGIVEYVVGTGGRSYYGFRDIADNSLVRNNDTFGVIRFELSAAAWSFEFVPVPRATFTDSGSGTCH